MEIATLGPGRRAPWNKGKLLGQKPPLRLKEIGAIRIRLQLDRDRPGRRSLTGQDQTSGGASQVAGKQSEITIDAKSRHMDP